MSHETTPSGRMSPDDRFELAARAQSQQRLNDPKHLIVLGALFLLVSIVVLVVAWRVRSSAERTNNRRGNELAQIQSLTAEIDTLRAAQASDPDQDRFEPINDLLSRLQRFASQSKLEHELGIPKQQSRPEGNTRLRTYQYTLRDPSLAHELDWITLSTQQIPGLNVTDLTIKPAKQDWTITVTLSRYERNR